MWSSLQVYEYVWRNVGIGLSLNAQFQQKDAEMPTFLEDLLHQIGLLLEQIHLAESSGRISNVDVHAFPSLLHPSRWRRRHCYP